MWPTMKLCAALCTVSSLTTTAFAATAAEDLATFAKRRVADLAEFPDPTWFPKIQTWIDTQRDDGTWADVNYLSGCAAQRANWPIQEHWNRVITLAAAWSGASPVAGQQWTNSTAVWAKISNGLDYWFKNDYTPADCLGNGGDDKKGCPCGTPGLWNTNWYGQAILIPQLSSTACLLVKTGNLSQLQRDGCIRITKRTYDNLGKSYGTGGILTAANIVLVLQSAVSLGLFTDNATIVESATSTAFDIMVFTDGAGLDGIHRDGSFLQHDGIVYNGNYGKDLLNIFISLEGEAIGTQFAADNTTREAMATYIQGDEWMIYTDRKTRQQHWDFNTIGRFVAFPTKDLQASADINFNITKLARAVADFKGPYNIDATIRRLKSNGSEPLTGNKGFWASDYMVSRTDSFILGNKMISKRSTNSEFVNSANPYSYHLGQGTLFSYVDGTEYKDIMAAWDWNLIPGTTVVRNVPDLTKTAPAYHGKTDFVGVVSNGKVGLAVENYLDPFNGHISYNKAWFHMGDAVLVTVTDIKTNGTVTSPVLNVLDNRAKADGGAYVDDDKVKALGSAAETKASGKTLFYGGNGYLSYGKPFDLTLSEGNRTGNWSQISTSTAGVVTVPIFSAFSTVQGSSASYAVFPATSRRTLEKESRNPTWEPYTANGISAAAGKDTLSVVFWPGAAADASITVDLKAVGWAKKGSVTITSSQPGAYVLAARCKKPGRGLRVSVTAADPTQKLASAGLQLSFSKATTKLPKGSDGSVKVDHGKAAFTFALPTGGLAGSSVKQDVLVITD